MTAAPTSIHASRRAISPIGSLSTARSLPHGDQGSLNDTPARTLRPEDDTPGCTAQACGIRDVWGELQRQGAVVLGISPDDPRSHARFKEKYGLPFTLLSDEDHAVAEQYGTWVEKAIAGRRYMGIERSTFVIDADGTVAKVMRRAKPAEHADDVLAALT